MLDLYPLLIQFIAAATLLLLWARETQRAYLLWWGIAQVASPFLAIAANRVHGDRPFDLELATFGYALFASILVAAFLQGTLLYRGIANRGKHIAVAGTAFFIVVLASVSLNHALLSAGMVLSAVVGTELASAVLLWPLGAIERVTAIFLILRCVGNIVVALFAGSSEAYLSYTDLTMIFASAVELATTLLFAVASFYRAQREREAHFHFLSTSNEITAQLQGVLDEDESGRRALDVILKQKFWDLGALMLIDESGNYLEIRVIRGAKTRNTEAMEKYKKMPLDIGLSGLAFRTRKFNYSFDVAKDGRIDPELRRISTNDGAACQVCVPIVSHDQALGVLLLRGNQPRHLLPNELLTLESLGKMLGVHLDNIRNMAALSFRATHDSLTGLGNRESLHTYFAGAGADVPCSLLLFDLDHFKDVNDSLGHTTGDRLLQALAQRLEKFIAQREGEIFRLGGDEFVVISRIAAGEDESMQLALELSRCIANPISIGDLVLRTSGSIGVARYPVDSANSHELLRCADAAMYHAKRNELPIAFYDTSIDAVVRERTLLISGMADALDRNELALFYQPIIDMKTGECVGCEALLRWNHPEQGLLPAAAFMPFVEKTDAIGRITRTVIEQAVLQLDVWARQGIRLKMSINFSARNFADNEIIGYLLKLTKAYRIEPRAIQIEITETTLMKDPAMATLALRYLRDAGFSVALDDYGTGYSSLAYLATFPIDMLKIDKSFVQHLENEPRAQAIIESTIALAHKLDLQVTAEGIETADEKYLLSECACDLGQGYLFATPMDTQAFSAWLSASRAPAKSA